MKIYLDDVRPAPEGWHLVYTPEEAIAYISRDIVDEVSLDHDLGLEPDRTGYTVMLWIENQVMIHKYFVPPKIHFHTMNPIGRAKMEAALRSIYEQLDIR